MKMRILSVFLLLPVILTGCKGSVKKIEGSVWNTTYHITYISPNDLNDSILGAINGVDRSLNAFNDKSLVARINGGDTTVAIDKMFRDVMTVSQRVARASGGLFDPTLSPLINLWGFGYGDKSTHEPTQAQIDSALEYVGINRTTIDDAGRLVRPRGMTFNFSAVAKGYGVDAVAQVLHRCGVTDYLIEIGGEVATSGLNSSGRHWRVMIEAPVEAVDGVVSERLAVIEPRGRSVATSGNYRNFRVVDGHKVGHTISPVTGRPVYTSTLSATVVASDCATADALATACMALETDEAKRVVDRFPGADVLLVVARGDSMSIETTSGFPQLY